MKKQHTHKFHIKKGDTVEVIAGNSKGTKGEVLEVIRSKDRAIVQGVAMVTKHIKPTSENPEGGIEQRESSVHISNLMLVDPKSGDKTRTGRKQDANGKLKRYSKKTNEFID